VLDLDILHADLATRHARAQVAGLEGLRDGCAEHGVLVDGGEPEAVLVGK